MATRGYLGTVRLQPFNRWQSGTNPKIVGNCVPIKWHIEVGSKQHAFAGNIAKIF